MAATGGNEGQMRIICAGSRTLGERISLLRATQNPDGGWAYERGSSWTEPTAFCLLALAGEPECATAIGKGVQWLETRQRRDGGWPPHPSVDRSTWVTALAALVLCAYQKSSGLDGATQWLARQTGEESTMIERLRRMLLGARMEAGEGTTGWPWYPGAAAWVMPTAMTMLALEQMGRSGGKSGWQERVGSGRQFLLARRCRDGGWNHGGSKALGYDAGSYPDTTGVALLALRGAQSPQIAAAVARAQQHWRDCRSAQGLSWLYLGLRAHGKEPAETKPCRLDARNTLDLALTSLAEKGWLTA